MISRQPLRGSALRNEINNAQTGPKLGINSDARYRFERGVDAEAFQAYWC
jgi:phenylalanyl-tRNA synthetase beta subunit